MAFKLPNWLTYTLTGLGGLIAGNLLTFFEVFRYFDTKPAIIVGYVENTAPDLRVHLDNAAQPQIVDRNNGYFRFEDLIPGTHNLRFEHVTFGSYSQPILVNGTGEHVLQAKVSLPKSVDTGIRSGPTLLAVSIQHSDDGSDPLTKYLADMDLQGITVFASGTTSSQDGWVYVGEGSASPATLKWLEDLGSTTEVAMPAVIRAAPPSEDKRALGYTLGLPVGELHPGQAVEVRELYEVEGDGSVWARVTIVDDLRYRPDEENRN